MIDEYCHYGDGITIEWAIRKLGELRVDGRDDPFQPTIA